MEHSASRPINPGRSGALEFLRGRALDQGEWFDLTSDDCLWVRLKLLARDTSGAEDWEVTDYSGHPKPRHRIQVHRVPEGMWYSVLPECESGRQSGTERAITLHETGVDNALHQVMVGMGLQGASVRAEADALERRLRGRITIATQAYEEAAEKANAERESRRRKEVLAGIPVPQKLPGGGWACEPPVEEITTAPEVRVEEPRVPYRLAEPRSTSGGCLTQALEVTFVLAKVLVGRR